MSMWGSRTRDRKRRRLLVNHNFDSVKVNVKRTTAKLLKQKTDNLEELQKKMRILTKKTFVGRNNIHNMLENESLISKLLKQIQFITDDKPFEEFVELVTPLLEDGICDSNIKKQQKHTVFLNAFHKEKVIPCFIEREICSKCNKEYVLVSQESILMCPTCGDSEHLLYCNSDFIENNDAKNNNPYERGPLYRKYLMQFHVNAPVPPVDVINIVYKHLSKVHIMLSTKVKPTPIAQILREEKLQRWTPYAVRIAKFINKEHIVKLSQFLIDTLVSRFDILTLAFTATKLKKRKKIMNFEFLTKQFLFMEDEPELAQHFSCHKTRLVLKQADVRLVKCSKVIKRKEKTRNWDVVRSC
jgi:hypothetical protein